MLEKELFNKLFSESFSVPVHVNYWDNTSKHYGNPDEAPKFTITFNEKIPMKDITKNASLTLGEAYMDKKIEVDGSLQELLTDAYRSADSFMSSSRYAKWIPKLARHTKKQNKQDIGAHYDLGNDFYELWLDPSLTYSCAYFKTPEDSLEEAQINKVRHILNKLFIKEGDTLLDIGCGWGTLMFTAIKEYGAHATGITLSEEQYKHITERIKEEGLEDKCTVLLQDYRELPDITFDHITSVGMFEHVGKENLEEYFKVISRHLKPEGTALIHGICGHKESSGTNAWINKYIFPGGYVPRVADMTRYIQAANLELIDLESLRRDYQLTLEHWSRNFHAVEDQVTDMIDERFFRMWSLYLESCAASFESSNIDVIQYRLVHPGNNTIPMHRYNGE